MAGSKTWFVIINPASGNGRCKKKWPVIKELLDEYDYDFDFVFTKYAKDSTAIVQNTIKKGFRNISKSCVSEIPSTVNLT